jgi:hypothetical protein
MDWIHWQIDGGDDGNVVGKCSVRLRSWSERGGRDGNEAIGNIGVTGWPWHCH